MSIIDFVIIFSGFIGLVVLTWLFVKSINKKLFFLHYRLLINTIILLLLIFGSDTIIIRYIAVAYLSIVIPTFIFFTTDYLDLEDYEYDEPSSKSKFGQQIFWSLVIFVFAVKSNIDYSKLSLTFFLLVPFVITLLSYTKLKIINWFNSIYFRLDNKIYYIILILALIGLIISLLMFKHIFL